MPFIRPKLYRVIQEEARDYAGAVEGRVSEVWFWLLTHDGWEDVPDGLGGTVRRAINSQALSLLNAQGEVRAAVRNRLNAWRAAILQQTGVQIEWAVLFTPAGGGPFIVLTGLAPLNIVPPLKRVEHRLGRRLRRALNRALDQWASTHTPEYDPDGELGDAD